MKPSFKEYLVDGIIYTDPEFAKRDNYLERVVKGQRTVATTRAMDQFRYRLELEKKLKAAREELKAMNASPLTQDIADAIDDARAEVADLEQKLAKAMAADGIKEAADTASSTFNFRYDQAERLIHGIIGKIQEFKVRQQSNPRDWGYAGSMAHVVELLEEIDQFFGGN